MTKRKVIDALMIAVSLIFAVVMVFYHFSDIHSLGLTTTQWNVLWLFSELGYPLIMSLYISYLTTGFIKMFFRWVLPPYFIIKIIYHFSRFAGVYIASREAWDFAWFFLIVIVLFSGLIYCLIKFILTNYGKH